MLPYIDLPGFTRRSVMPAGDISVVESMAPGFTATRIVVWQSAVNARLRKRYGRTLPLGQQPPALVAVGLIPPEVTLTGRPVLGSAQYQLVITTGGLIGAAVFSWSADNGQTFITGVPVAATVQLGATGVTANFPAGPYDTSNLYTAATPVPEAVLGWITALVTVDLYRKRGVNPQDPTIVMVREDADRAIQELREAADSEVGLFDLPQSDDLGSAVDTGGPHGYSETSPYKWTDIERGRGRREDEGNGGGWDGNGPIGGG